MAKKDLFSCKKRTCSSVFIDAAGNVTDTLPTTPVMIEMKLEVPKSYNDWATVSFIFPNQDIDTTNNTPMKDKVIDIIRRDLPVCDVDESSLKNNNGNGYTINIGIEPKAKSADLDKHRMHLAKIFCDKMYQAHKKKYATPQPQPQQQNPQPQSPQQQQQNPQPAQQQQQNPQPAQQQQQNPQPQSPQQQQNPQPAQQQQNPQPAQQQQPQNPQPAQQPQNPQPAQQQQPQNPQPAQQQQPQNPQPAQQQQNPQPAQPAPERLKPGCNPTGMLLTQLSQKASVDEHNRIRRLCGMPERQFILDDGTVYPPTI